MKRQLPIDFIYPGLFAVTYTLMLVWLFGKKIDSKSKVFYLVLIPAAAGLFDYFENIGIILMLKSLCRYVMNSSYVILASSIFR